MIIGLMHNSIPFYWTQKLFCLSRDSNLVWGSEDGHSASLNHSTCFSRPGSGHLSSRWFGCTSKTWTGSSTLPSGRRWASRSTTFGRHRRSRARSANDCSPSTSNVTPLIRFLNRAISGFFFVHFRSPNTQTIFTSNKCKNDQSSTHNWDSNS